MTDLDAISTILRGWRVGYGTLTFMRSDSDEPVLFSRYRHYIRVYVHAGGRCRDVVVDLNETEAHWRALIAPIIEWAQNKDDEDAA